MVIDQGSEPSWIEFEASGSKLGISNPPTYSHTIFNGKLSSVLPSNPYIPIYPPELNFPLLPPRCLSTTNYPHPTQPSSPSHPSSPPSTSSTQPPPHQQAASTSFPDYLYPSPVSVRNRSMRAYSVGASRGRFRRGRGRRRSSRTLRRDHRLLRVRGMMSRMRSRGTPFPLLEEVEVRRRGGR
jgi:hypothetical protein